MKLYLVRHGEAVSEEVDLARPLSRKGREQISKLAHLLKPRVMDVRLIYHSGKKRARETAKILQNVLNIQCPLTAKDFLSPDDPVDKIYNEILQGQDNLMIVGHMPFLSRLTSKLVLGSENKEIIGFKTGTMVALEKLNNEQWQVIFSVSPD